MSNRLYQGIIHQLHEAVDRVIGVIDNNGTIVACSELSKIGESHPNVREELMFSPDVAVIDGYTYSHIGNLANFESTVFVEGE